MISKYSVRRPFTVLVGVVLILILGYVSLTRMTADLLPDMEFPYAIVITTYPGASPEEVESVITSPIEQSMATLSNIETVSSISNENYSVVILQFAQSTNMDSASLDMRESLDQLESSWTDDLIGSPIIMKINPDMLPIMIAGAEHEDYKNPVELTNYVKEKILPELQSVAGVASVSVSGEMEESVQVILREEKIKELNEKIHDALDGKFEDAEKKIEKAQKKLNSSKKKLEKTQDSLNKNTDKLATGVGDGQSTMTQKQSELLKTQSDLEDQLKTVETNLSDVQKQRKELVAKKKELKKNITTLKTLPSKLESVNDAITQLEAGKKQLEALGEAGATQLATVNAQLEELYAARTELETQVAAMDSNLTALTNGIAEIDAGIKQIDDGIKQLKSARSQLKKGIAAVKSGQKTLTEALGELNASGISNSVKLAVGITQVSSGLSQIEEGQTQLDNSKKELEDAKQAAYDSADMEEIITASLVKQLLSAQNFSMPAGYITEEGIDYLVRVGNEATSTKGLGSIVLMDLHMKDVDPIRLRDVADIIVTDNSDEVYANINGNPGILFTLEKQTGYSTGNVSKALAKRFAQLEGEQEGLHFITLMDQGDYIDIITNSVFSNLLFGALLAMIILLIFLRDIRPTIIVAFSIPLSLLTCIVCMYFSDISLNMISLSALALAVGMLVDNSIVVIENIYRLRNEGMSAKRAAVEGAKQVAGAITASTLTTVCVFLPIVFTEGITRQLFVDMGLTIGYALIASLAVALTLVPALSSGMLKKSKEKTSKILDAVLNVYGKMISWCLKLKPVVLLAALLILVGAAYISYQKGTALFPDMNGNQVSVTIEVEEGQGFEELTKAADTLTERILKLDGVQDIGTAAGSSGGSISMTSLSGSNNKTSASMYLIMDEEKGYDPEKLTAEIEDCAKDLNCTVSVKTATMDLSSYMAQGVSIRVEARDLDDLEAAAKDIAAIVETVEGLENVSDGMSKTTPEISMKVNRKKAMKYGLTTAQVYQAVSAELADATSNMTLTTEDAVYDVYVIDGTKEELTKEKLEDMKITGTNSKKESVEVSLSKLVTFEEGIGMNSIRRTDQSRYLTVTADVADGYNVGLVSKDLTKAMEAYETPKNVSWTMDGENEYINEAFGQIGLMLAMAIAFMYLIMVAQFQSLLSPFIIMFTIPLAFTGGFLGLWATNSPISIIAAIGFVMLSGIIVNNGIVMVDYINQLRYTGMEKREAIIEAGKTRLRPILMTALTTILAMSTMMFGNDLGVALGKPMTVVTIGGLLYGTLLTLFVVPCMYDLLNRKKELKDPLAELDKFEE